MYKHPGVLSSQSRLLNALLIAVMAVELGCGGGLQAVHDAGSTGSINASVRFITTGDGLPITKIHITVNPANVTQDLTYDAQLDEFTGVITTPPGAQTVTATAFSGAIVLGSGSATTTVAKHVTATVLIKILDSSSRSHTQDHGPIILSVSASPGSSMVGDTVRLTAVATDPDGDPITYQWNQDCVGTFSAQTSASTDWTGTAAQTCSITVVASSKSLMDTYRISMTVQPASGELSMSALFVLAPYITQLELTGGGLNCSIDRDASDASCRPAIAPSTVLTATVTFDPMPSDSGGNVLLTDNCGGASTRAGLDLPGGSATFSWTAPGSSGACLLTATASRETLTDAQRVAVAID